jgi:hypothetical protein
MSILSYIDMCVRVLFHKRSKIIPTTFNQCLISSDILNPLSKKISLIRHFNIEKNIKYSYQHYLSLRAYNNHAFDPFLLTQNFFLSRHKQVCCSNILNDVKQVISSCITAILRNFKD